MRKLAALSTTKPRTTKEAESSPRFTIEQIRKVWRGKMRELLPGCGRLELAPLFDIAEKRKIGDHHGAAVAYADFVGHNSLETAILDELLKLIEKHTILKRRGEVFVYDRLSSGKLAHRYA